MVNLVLHDRLNTFRVLNVRVNVLTRNINNIQFIIFLSFQILILLEPHDSLKDVFKPK